jgi:3-hydroxybutyryl-CoA dehydratase
MSVSLPATRTFRYEDIEVGMQMQHDYAITAEVYGHFLAAFGDRSPIHVDEAYAKESGFSGKVMHGTLLNGFLSHFVGTYFPGRLSLLLAADLRYAQPCYLDDAIRLEMKVDQKMEARKIVVLHAVFTNLTRRAPAARGRVQVMLRDK